MGQDSRHIRKRRLGRIRPFTAYLITVSGWFFGFGLQTTLFPGVINYTLNESPDRLGIAQAALTAPMLLFLPLAGVIAERVDRRTLLAGFYLVAATASYGLSWLLMSGRLSYEILVGFALVIGLAGAFVMPARDSAVNPVTRISQRMGKTDLTLQKAIILASLIQFAAQIAGMGMGFLAENTGPGLLFSAQGAGLLFGAMAALSMPRLHARHQVHGSIWSSLTDGMKTVWASPVLLPMTLIMVAVGILIVGGGFFIIVPVLVRDGYEAGYGVLSTLLVTFWIGALIANVLLAQFKSIERPGRVLLMAQLVNVITFGVLYFPVPLPMMYGLVLAWGLGAGVAISLSRAVVQENTPEDKMARVMSVYQLGLFGGMPLGALFMGYTVAMIGPRSAALIPMAGLLLVLIWIALATPLLKLKRAEPE